MSYMTLANHIAGGAFAPLGRSVLPSNRRAECCVVVACYTPVLPVLRSRAAERALLQHLHPATELQTPRPARRAQGAKRRRRDPGRGPPGLLSPNRA